MLQSPTHLHIAFSLYVFASPRLRLQFEGGMSMNCKRKREAATKSRRRISPQGFSSSHDFWRRHRRATTIVIKILYCGVSLKSPENSLSLMHKHGVLVYMLDTLSSWFL